MITSAFLVLPKRCRWHKLDGCLWHHVNANSAVLLLSISVVAWADSQVCCHRQSFLEAFEFITSAHPLSRMFFTPKVLMQVYWWHDKYRPRKPKYFNRVHTGYEWNKYNQTHYDHDNPPPKVSRPEFCPNCNLSKHLGDLFRHLGDLFRHFVNTVAS